MFALAYVQAEEDVDADHVRAPPLTLSSGLPPAPSCQIYRALPRVTFIDPEIGAVGLTERQAREQGLRVRTGVLPLSSSTRGWIHRPGNAGFIKPREDAERGVLIGAASAGRRGARCSTG